MITVFYYNENEIEKTNDLTTFARIAKDKIVWVDLQFPTEDEQRRTELFFNINFSAQQEASDIESNSRFYEAEDFIFINSGFALKIKDSYENHPVLFYLLEGILVTKREVDLATFSETVNKIKRNKKSFKNGNEVLEGLLETKVDLDSDHMEQISKEIGQLGKDLSSTDLNEEKMLIKLNQYQESAMFLREGFVDKLRVVSSLMKCEAFFGSSRLSIVIKDINTMLDFSSFIFKRLEYLQNTLMGLIDVQQSKTIKIFTVVSVAFLPPMLIAGIYGMNFKSMPELEWSWGYPFAILLIIGSSFLTLLIFKVKKWI